MILSEVTGCPAQPEVSCSRGTEAWKQSWPSVSELGLAFHALHLPVHPWLRACAWQPGLFQHLSQVCCCSVSQQTSSRSLPTWPGSAHPSSLVLLPFLSLVQPDFLKRLTKSPYLYLLLPSLSLHYRKSGFGPQCSWNFLLVKQVNAFPITWLRGPHLCSSEQILWQWTPSLACLPLLSVSFHWSFYSRARLSPVCKWLPCPCLKPSSFHTHISSCGLDGFQMKPKNMLKIEHSCLPSPKKTKLF